MDFPTLLTEEQISKFTTEVGLSRQQIIEFYAEFKAYDTDGSGAITSINLGIVNKVKHLSLLSICTYFLTLFGWTHSPYISIVLYRVT